MDEDPRLKAEQSSYPLTESLQGVRIEITTAGGEVFPGLPLSIMDSRVRAVLPSVVPVGEHRIQVFRTNVPSASHAIKVVQTSPGIFTNPRRGYRGLAGRDISTPASPGERISVWTTGLGPIGGSDSLPPPVGDLPTELTVTIGNVDAEILYQGRAPCCAGLDQVDVLIPEEVPIGCFVPIWITAYDSLYSNVAVLPISRPGLACWQTESTVAEPVIEGPTGRVLLTKRTEHTADTRRTITKASSEFISPLTVAAPPNPFDGDDLSLLPPPGTCVPAPSPSPSSSQVPFTQPDPPLLPFSFLNAGDSFALATPSGPSSLVPVSRPATNSALGPLGVTLTADPPLNLLPGPYLLESEGGPDFPPFTADFNLPPAPLWTNSNALPSFPRSQGLTLEWQGGAPEVDQLATLHRGCPPGEFCMYGSLLGYPDNLADYFVCRAAPGATSIEVPPAFYANETTTAARLQLVNLPRPAEMQFATDGPESGLVIIRDSESVPLALDLPHLASTPVTLPDGSLVQAELAANSSERQRGLMFRPSLKPNGGMLFLFNQSARWSFWMFNTLIPLDIIWLNEDREIIFINQDTPPCPGQPCPVYGPNVVSRSVLELAAGEAARRNLQPGDQLDW